MISLGRISAIVERHWYLISGSGPRVLELMFWPTLQLLMWGFITQFLAGQSGYVASAIGIFMAAALLWDVFIRSELGLALSFLEEAWSRNLGHLFVSPLRPIEFCCGLVTISMIRTLIGITPATFLSIWFFDYSIYGLGLPLIGFFLNLVIMGWSIGLCVAGLVLRYGLSAESLAWLLCFALAPVCGIYYPISVLPEWIQPISFILPASHVFEGMRAILVDRQFAPVLMLYAFGLNGIWLFAGGWVFSICLKAAKRRGQILQMGE